MGYLRNNLFRVGLMAISLFAFAACSSTGETDDAAGGSQSASAGSSASSSAGASSGRLSEEEMRAQNALRQTVFYFDFDIALSTSAHSHLC